MQILFWRHAEAEDGHPDLERVLTRHGQAQAQTMAGWLNSRLPPDTRALVSPAMRTRQTLAALTRLGWSGDVSIEPGIAPGASVQQIFDTLNLTAAAAQSSSVKQAGSECLLVVGHQPWIGEAVSWLACGTPQGWAIRRSGLWWLEQREKHRHAPWRIRAVMDPELVQAARPGRGQESNTA